MGRHRTLSARGIQAAGAIFALGVALWAFQGMSGRQTLALLAGYARGSHAQLLAAGVGDVLAGTARPIELRARADGQYRPAASPALAAVTPGGLDALPDFPGADLVPPAATPGLPLVRRDRGPRRSDRPDPPPPRLAG